MNSATTLIYLMAKPGVGKYTIAKEIARNHSFIVCDNQLINNPIFELLQYDGYASIPDFAWGCITEIRTAIFKFLMKEQLRSYVLTNCLAETEKDRLLYDQVKDIAETRGSLFVPVQLVIAKEEHLKRLTKPERKARWKSIDPQDAEDQGPLLSISHPNFLELEVSNLSPNSAAARIMKHIQEVENLSS